MQNMREKSMKYDLSDLNLNDIEMAFKVNGKLFLNNCMTAR